jgi:hypothetical protein
MSYGFKNLSLAVRTYDGHNFILLEPLEYVTQDGRVLRAIDGGSTDGISTPRFVWDIIPPFGPEWFPGLLHDAGYHNFLQELQPDGTWTQLTLSRFECDELMKEALAAQGVADVEIETIYYSLRLGGGSAFDSDRHA